MSAIPITRYESNSVAFELGSIVRAFIEHRMRRSGDQRPGDGENKARKEILCYNPGQSQFHLEFSAKEWTLATLFVVVRTGEWCTDLIAGEP